MPDVDDYTTLDIPEQARHCRHQAITAESKLREEFDRRMRFRAGDQWESKDVNARGKDRPAITVNLLEQPVTQVVNSMLHNRPGGKVSPADDDATSDVAEFWQGRIRHIEYASDSQVAYGTCIGYVAAGGRGLVGLTIDYVAPDSFEQEPRIRTIEDPACWALDPSAREPDGRDMRWAIGRQKFSKEEFKRRWPDAEVADASFYTTGNYDEWFESEAVWVGEYWRLDYRKRKLQRYADGSTGFADDKDNQGKQASGESREVEYPYVTQYLISGIEVLDETPWPGTRIPIYEVIATEFYSEGKRVIKSLISDSIPSQQTYNFSESLKLEAVALAPKPKWIVTSEQIAGHEQQWRTANTSTDATLFYNGMTDSRGNPVPAPTWQVFVPPVQEFAVVSNAAKEDVKSTTGFFDPALGALDPQRQSGKAILALQQQTGVGVIHFTENLGRALKALYQDVIDIDRKLHMKFIGKLRSILPDGKHELVGVNDQGAQKPLLLGKGRYEVVISVGPSYQTQRQAAGDFIDTVASNDPQGWMLIRDIAAKLKEPELGHFADEIATRWTPPQFAQQDPNAPPLPPQVQQQMALLPQLTQRVNELTQVIQQKQVEEQGKFEREMAVEKQKYATEELKAATQIQVAELNAKNDFLLTTTEARVKAMLADFEGAIKSSLQGHKQAHEAAMAAQQHAHAMHQQQAANENQMALAEAAPQSQNGDGGGTEAEA